MISHQVLYLLRFDSLALSTVISSSLVHHMTGWFPLLFFFSTHHTTYCLLLYGGLDISSSTPAHVCNTHTVV